LPVVEGRKRKLEGKELIEHCTGQRIGEMDRVANKNHVIVIRSKEDMEKMKDFAELMDEMTYFVEMTNKNKFSIGEIVDMLGHFDFEMLKRQAREEILRTVTEVRKGERTLEA
jgi:GTPase involved in cell partitioning and DNA repair